LKKKRNELLLGYWIYEEDEEWKEVDKEMKREKKVWISDEEKWEEEYKEMKRKKVMSF
jgi:hypothetical protein